ncbi:MAG TPA: tetratricopeptide repeat protein [Tepidisphaeraceae bacterium]|nr:tetratricopeptide repeat protein [Tepidisphaeraceae bacterium]
MSLETDPSFRAAMSLQNSRYFSEAILAWRKVLAEHPGSIPVYLKMALCYRAKGPLAEALAVLQEGAAIEPNNLSLMIPLAGCFRALGRLEEAAAQCRRAIELSPRWVEPYNRLAEILTTMGRFSEVEAVYRGAIALDESHAGAHFNLGTNLQGQGRPDEAAAELRRAAELAPNWPATYSRLLLVMLHQDGVDPQDLFEAHQQWASRHGFAGLLQNIQYSNNRDPHRKLRIGYLSSDFREHSVMYFLEPVLANYDRLAFEVYCYSDVPGYEWDSTTERMYGYVDVLRNITTHGLAEIVKMIRTDGIDILVDLSGHTAPRLLQVMSARPAPVQVTGLGYPATTGLSSIDYRLTDSIADPPGESDRLHTERLVRLDPCGWCYGPPDDAPPVAPPPSVVNGFITFGSFNLLAKMGPRVIGLWSQILKEVAGSRLLLKAQSFSDESTRKRILEAFGQAGIDANRIELLPRTEGTANHLSLYDRLDIALDPFPYNGTTTTCEALWMGVPVITLKGASHASRVGTSLLHASELSDLIGDSPQEYVRIAADLAADRDRLASLRASMRSRLEASPLRDEINYTQRLESAYRKIWESWCSGKRG